MTRIGRTELHAGFLQGNTKEGDHLDNLEVNGILLKCVLKEQGVEGVDSVMLAQDKDKWSPLTKTGINRRLQYRTGTFLTNCRTVQLVRREYLLLESNCTKHCGHQHHVFALLSLSLPSGYINIRLLPTSNMPAPSLLSSQGFREKPADEDIQTYR